MYHVCNEVEDEHATGQHKPSQACISWSGLLGSETMHIGRGAESKFFPSLGEWTSKVVAKLGTC